MRIARFIRLVAIIAFALLMVISASCGGADEGGEGGEGEGEGEVEGDVDVDGDGEGESGEGDGEGESEGEILADCETRGSTTNGGALIVCSDVCDTFASCEVTSCDCNQVCNSLGWALKTEVQDIWNDCMLSKTGECAESVLKDKAPHLACLAALESSYDSVAQERKDVCDAISAKISGCGMPGSEVAPFDLMCRIYAVALVDGLFSELDFCAAQSCGLDFETCFEGISCVCTQGK